jgi:hypothetical protein
VLLGRQEPHEPLRRPGLIEPGPAAHSARGQLEHRALVLHLPDPLAALAAELVVLALLEESVDDRVLLAQARAVAVVRPRKVVERLRLQAARRQATVVRRLREIGHALSTRSARAESACCGYVERSNNGCAEAHQASRTETAGT